MGKIERLDNKFHPYPKERQLYRNKKRDLKAVREFKKKYPRCIICGKKSTPHHVKSRGAGGADSENNLMPLCLKHHIQRNILGRREFRRRYPEVRNWLTIPRPVREKNGSK